MYKTLTMKLEDKISRLQFVIGRYDQYYEGINSKVALLLSLATAFPLINIFTSNHFDSDLIPYPFLHLLSLILTLLVYVSLILSSFPFLSSTNNSLIFFGDVSKLKMGEYKQRLDSESEDNFYDDLCAQSFYLSKGLKNKHNRICIATILISIQLIISIVPIIIDVL